MRLQTRAIRAFVRPTNKSYDAFKLRLSVTLGPIVHEECEKGDKSWTSEDIIKHFKEEYSYLDGPRALPATILKGIVLAAPQIIQSMIELVFTSFK